MKFIKKYHRKEALKYSKYPISLNVIIISSMNSIFSDGQRRIYNSPTLIAHAEGSKTSIRYVGIARSSFTDHSYHKRDIQTSKTHGLLRTWFQCNLFEVKILSSPPLMEEKKTSSNIHLNISLFNKICRLNLVLYFSTIQSS